MQEAFPLFTVMESTFQSERHPSALLFSKSASSLVSAAQMSGGCWLLSIAFCLFGCRQIPSLLLLTCKHNSHRNECTMAAGLECADVSCVWAIHLLCCLLYLTTIYSHLCLGQRCAALCAFQLGNTNHNNILEHIIPTIWLTVCLRV